MSKDESMCKVMGGGKHKERKPKKPHYIPRPWGKPYNYKCFQCPFTCMEKSHLYNHMKYSLCKNSLSLLIESDWPYKKGNLLPPDHIRLQQGALGPRSPAKEQSQRSAEEAPAGRRRSEVPFSDDGEEAEGVAEGDANQGEETGTKGTAASQSPEPAEACPRGGAKCAKPEADLVMADVFSLEEQLLRARSVEVEAKLRHYRLSKTCLSTPAALLSEQWRLLGYSKPKAEASAPPQPPPPQLPCYPPPGSLDSQDATGLNLSLFGVGYPLPPSLFSYLNPTLNPTLNPVVSPTLGAGPFLTHAHTDRSLLPPRLYYPFLCEHTFGNPVSADVGKTPGKPSVVGPDGAVPGYPLKQGMWKVPVLRPTSSQASHAAWASPAGSSPELGHPAGERPPAATGSREPGRKRAAVHMDSFESPAEKSAALGFPLNLLKSIHRTTPTTAMATDRLNLHNSVRAQTGVDDWFSDLGKAERTPSETPSTQSTSERDRAVGGGGEEGDGDADSATSLLHNLTKVLREYQHAEQRAAMMQSEERPAQRHLLAHLGKIRSELSHIQQALEQTARHSDGPLDLSVKKDQGATVTGEGTGQDAGDAKEASSETSSETEAEEEGDEEECEDEGMDAKERRKRSLDALIKLNQVGVSMVKSEGLSGPWPGRTTKCEADSSVLLGPDHRPASLQTKTLGRSHSIPHFSTSMCPPSPLIGSEPSDIP